MKIRRCSFITIESRERTEFDLFDLSQGGTGLSAIQEWIAMAPHARGEQVVSHQELRILGTVSAKHWRNLSELSSIHSREILDALIDKELLIVEGTLIDERDRAVERTHWYPAAAAVHYSSRWQGVDTEKARQQFSEFAGGGLIENLDSPPPPVVERCSPVQRRYLHRASLPTPLDRLLEARVTCRNFASTASLSFEAFSSVIFRAFGARAVDEHASGIKLLKKGVPSAGSLHATEAYLLIQRVEGIAVGLYHYHPIEHALEPVRLCEASEATLLARRFVAEQEYFSDAQVIVIPTSRFARNFWKYRNHAKAYRALILDIGHLSQTMYLAATELGLAAFITAAINEVDIEQAFGLDPLEEGPLAVCGFGIRAAQKKEIEFDPLGAVWGEATV